MGGCGGEVVTAGQSPSAGRCSIAAALDIVGERWSLLIIAKIGCGVHRFTNIAGSIGVPRDTLASRLRKLEGAGVIERRCYSERPRRFEYHLTEAGRDLFPVIIALDDWGASWAVSVPVAKTMDHSKECG